MTTLAPRKQDVLKRLESARGHLDAVIRMVAQDRYCIDVLHQIRAVQGALDRSRRGLLEDHLHTCLPDAYAAGTYEHTTTELLDAILGGGVPRTGRGRCHHERTTGDQTGDAECCATRRDQQAPHASQA